MTHEDIWTEKLARVIHAHDGLEALLDWDHVSNSQREGYLFVARAVINNLPLDARELSALASESAIVVGIPGLGEEEPDVG